MNESLINAQMKAARTCVRFARRAKARRRLAHIGHLLGLAARGQPRRVATE